MTIRHSKTDASHIVRSTSGASPGITFTSARSDSLSNITKNRTVVIRNRASISKLDGRGELLDFSSNAEMPSL